MATLKQELITAADVLRRGSPYRDCELWDGASLVREPSGGEAEAVSTLVVAALSVHARGRGLGRAFGSSQGFLLTRDPDRMLAPDGAYVSRKRLPELPRRGFIEMAPDFLIEVRSPEDAWEAVVQKCGIWIAHGAGCAWGIDPFSRTVAEFRPGQPPVVHAGGEGAASGAPVLPEFSLSVASLFEDL